MEMEPAWWLASRSLSLFSFVPRLDRGFFSLLDYFALGNLLDDFERVGNAAGP